MDSCTGFIVVDKDGDPVSPNHLKVYFERSRAEWVAKGELESNPKLGPFSLKTVRLEVQPS